MADKKLILNALGQLSGQIRDRHPLLEANIHRTSFHNPWFEKTHYWQSLDAISDYMLKPDALDKWCDTYQFPLKRPFQKIVGLIFAGNIPLVGFHDFLALYLSGHAARIKLSGKDPYVFPVILQLLGEMDPEIHERIQVVEKLEDFDAVIATGSNNTNRYFKKYFKDYPSLLRKNRTSVAILDGAESQEDLTDLSRDMFDYFGLGCRNVTKLFVPVNYDFEPLLEAMKPYGRYMNNTKYKNNYDYYLSIELLNKNAVISTDFLLLKKDPIALSSPVGVIHYDNYSDLDELLRILSLRRDELQTVVGKYKVEGVSRTDFGDTQHPGIFDYPDGEDTGHFLFDISCNSVI